MFFLLFTPVGNALLRVFSLGEVPLSYLPLVREPARTSKVMVGIASRELSRNLERLFLYRKAEYHTESWFTHRRDASGAAGSCTRAVPKSSGKMPLEYLLCAQFASDVPPVVYSLEFAHLSGKRLLLGLRVKSDNRNFGGADCPECFYSSS